MRSVVSMSGLIDVTVGQMGRENAKYDHSVGVRALCTRATAVIILYEARLLQPAAGKHKRI
jgi:hypothetical protein